MKEKMKKILILIGKISKEIFQKKKNQKKKLK